MSSTFERKRHVDLVPFTRDASRLTIEEAAAAVEGKAIARAPVARVGGGTLKSSIGRRVLNPETAEVYAAAEYAVYQEFGWRYFPGGQPFLRPALDEFRAQLDRVWGKATGDAYARNKR